ncbi:MAG: cellulase family glycosylhydrolase [Solirubrobacteraceae bacterium]|nr:cellulase family glycosylhydrolase [Solirubrobacteraceae bacterium]
MNAEDVYAGDDAYQAEMFAQLRAAGVTVMRQNFRWEYTVPSRGVYAWAQLDRFVLAAARQRMKVLALVYGEPAWATSRPPGQEDANCTFPPADNADYGEFARQIVLRYGRGGAFWNAYPDLAAFAITDYELWNEPTLPRFWGCTPDAAAYVAMARAASQAIRAVDPQATIISAGTPDETARIRAYFKAAMRAGARSVFTALGVHSYGVRVQTVVNDLQSARTVIDAAGLKHWPIHLTEWGWATAGPASVHTVSEPAQARAVGSTIRLLWSQRHRLKLRTAIHYEWSDLPPPPGHHEFWGLNTGLLREDLTAKPALASFSAAANGLR